MSVNSLTVQARLASGPERQNESVRWNDLPAEVKLVGDCESSKESVFVID